MVVLDLGARWRDCFPSAERDARQPRIALQSFICPRTNVNTCQRDGARVLYKVAVDLGIRPTTSRPYVSQSNSLVERATRHMEEGARTVLRHAGLPPQQWTFAANHFCDACNFDETQGESPWSRRHGSGPIQGTSLPFVRPGGLPSPEARAGAPAKLRPTRYPPPSAALGCTTPTLAGASGGMHMCLVGGLRHRASFHRCTAIAPACTGSKRSSWPAGRCAPCTGSPR